MSSTTSNISKVRGVVIRGPMLAGFDTILTTGALEFLAELHRKFEPTRRALLAARESRQNELDSGKFPTFLPETAHIRSGNWTGPTVIPADLQDRRVEITGPVDRKMIINALNSGSKVFMADFEDSTSPTWINLVSGQLNLRDAVNRTIEYTAPGSNKQYKLNSTSDSELAVLFVRPRGWHLSESHLLIDGDPISGSIFDYGLYFYHNYSNLLGRNTAPYYYLPKMESHREARLWNDIFLYSQSKFELPIGTIRATVLIETILAAFEMDEILYELKSHSAGLNCGRWDYIFSFIKKFRNHSQFLLPDRSTVTMDTPFMANYVKLLVQTCHRRGVHAMGGMAAQIPVQNNPAINTAAMNKVNADKLQEVQRGHDGTWVAHPALIPIALKVFNQYMPQPNQINKPLDKNLNITATDLLNIGMNQQQRSVMTVTGLLNNIDVGINYIEAWLRGLGCVPLHNLMEDAATAEISRCQLWQWKRHSAVLTDGTKVNKSFLIETIKKESARIQSSPGATGNDRQYELATKLYLQMITNDRLDDFLTLIAYPYITQFTDKDNNNSSNNKKSLKSKL